MVLAYMMEALGSDTLQCCADPARSAPGPPLLSLAPRLYPNITESSGDLASPL
jgi:hypothetical protein